MLITKNKLQVLDITQITKWVLFLLSLLIVSPILEPLIILIYIGLFMGGFLILKKPVFSLNILITWIYLSQFYKGQGYFGEFDFYSKIVEKIFILVFLANIFLLSYRSKKNRDDSLLKFNNILIIAHIVLAVLLLINLYNYDYNPYTIFSKFRYLYIYLIILELKFSFRDIRSLFNLLISICIIQVPLTLLQYFRFIKPPSQTTVSGVKWIAGLDDVASGSFGASASPDLSLCLINIAVLLITFGIITKKKSPLILCVFLFIPFMVCDSKTGVFVLIVTIISLFFYLSKQISTADLGSYMFAFFTILITIIIFKYSWDLYYKHSFGKNYERMRETKIDFTISEIKKDFFQWGKIKGYAIIADMQLKESPLTLFLGFGYGNYIPADSSRYEYSSNNRYLKANRGISPQIERDNSLNFRSLLIEHFAETGIVGLLFLFFIYYNLWKYYSNLSFKTTIGESLKLSIKPIIIGNFVWAFIYYGAINWLSVCIIWILIATIIKYEEVIIVSQ